MGCASSLLMNALKALAGVDDDLLVIDDEVIAPICHLKTEHLKSTNPRLHSDETLLALAVSSRGNAIAAQLMDSINKLKGCDAHFSVIISPTDENLYRTLGTTYHANPNSSSVAFTTSN